MKALVDLWLRRSWRPEAAAQAAFADKQAVTVITGASNGIGRALALRCAQRGQSLLLIGRHAEPLAAVAAEIRRSRGDASADILPIDIAADDAIETLEAWLARNVAYVELLINNAGIGLSGPFSEHEQEAPALLVDLNVTAATRLLHHVLPGMLKRGSGGVINIASLGGLVPGPYQATYYASKAYLISLTRAVAWEIRGQGVRILAVAPGPVDTDFHARMGAESALYRLLLPGLSADRVAKSALFGYDFGRTLVVPGLFNKLAALCLHILPASLMIPLIAILLKPRRKERHVRGKD
jgi:uncharacterized protein